MEDFNPKELINWSKVSTTLSGSDNSVRSNKVPKKYQNKVNRLLKIITIWSRWAG